MTATLDDFRAQHSRAITRLYTLARARRWGLAEVDFGAALHRSQASHFRSSSQVGRREIERYLQSLELADLALVCACRRDIPHAWQSLHADYLPLLQEAVRATLPDADAARGRAEALFAELHGPRGDVLEQYHGRSRLKTWLRAVVARLHDTEIRSPGSVATEGTEADAWFAALGETLAALEPPDRLRLAAYALERLPLASIAGMLGETRLNTARRVRRVGGTLRRDVVRRLGREASLERREIRRIERAASELVPDGDRRTPIEVAVAVALERRLNAPGRQCPPPATLAALVEGRLGEAERHSTVLHASSCRGCVRQIGVLARLERPGLAPEALRVGRRSSLVAIASVVGAFVALAAGVFALDQTGILRDAIRRLTPSADEAPFIARDGETAARSGTGAPEGGGSEGEVTIPGETPTPGGGDATPLAARPASEASPTIATDDPASRRTATETAVPVAAATASPPATSTTAPTATATRTAVPTATRTAIPTATRTAIPTPTRTAIPTATRTAIPVPTRTAPPKATAVPPATRAPAPERTAAPTARTVATPRPATLVPTALPTPPPRVRHPGDQPGATVLVLAPGARHMRWWLAANGALALTRDGGGTWTPIASGVATDLLCGAATSDRVVWIGGRSGTLLRSLDGISFAPVPGPTAEDVTAITASDSRRATITTASGARFATEDGGASWRRL